MQCQLCQSWWLSVHSTSQVVLRTIFSVSVSLCVSVCLCLSVCLSLSLSLSLSDYLLLTSFWSPFPFHALHFVLCCCCFLVCVLVLIFFFSLGEWGGVVLFLFRVCLGFFVLFWWGCVNRRKNFKQCEVSKKKKSGLARGQHLAVEKEEI